MFDLKAYREKNAEKLKAQRLAWYKKNREKEAARLKKYRSRPEVKKRIRVRAHKWYLKNRERLQEERKNKKEYYRQRSKVSYQKHRNKVLARSKEWHQKNRDKVNQQARNRREQNPEKHLAYTREWWDKNRKRVRSQIREKEKERYAQDVQFKLRKNLRNRLNAALRNNSKRGHALDYLGCDVSTFKKYIEKQFETGMSWKNWSRKGWHIDHIKPLCTFDLADEKHLRRALHYTNMRPLWANENLQRPKKKKK